MVYWSALCCSIALYIIAVLDSAVQSTTTLHYRALKFNFTFTVQISTMQWSAEQSTKKVNLYDNCFSNTGQ